MDGMTEAEIMRAKGYTEKDVFQADVQKAYAAGLGQMGSNGGGSGLGDIANLGVVLGALGGVIGMTKEAMAPMFGHPEPSSLNSPPISPAPVAEGWNCSCGQKSIVSKFCPECGAKRPEKATVWDCNCGAKGLTGKFCPECGAKRLEQPDPWDCECGQQGITGKFCPECGKKRG